MRLLHHLWNGSLYLVCQCMGFNIVMESHPPVVTMISICFSMSYLLSKTLISNVLEIERCYDRIAT
jgi:hypothetical protein